MHKNWFDEAWDDYLYWQTQDKKALKRINTILKDIERHPFEGIGKPEPLRANFGGLWSRRIDEKNRMVYLVRDGSLHIFSCRGHYE